MADNLKKSEAIALVGEVLPERPSIENFYRDFIADKDKRTEDKDKKKKKKDGKKKKSRKEEELERYDQYFGTDPVLLLDRFDPFLCEQAYYQRGNIIPETLKLNLYEDSGFFFGTKREPNGYVGKPASQDGHILVAGVPGSGKTMGIVIPTLMTWHGSQVILDVKGDLYQYWSLLNRHKGKRVFVFNPENLDKYGSGSCRYDPYAPLRQGGESELDDNVKDLAMALIPLPPSVKEPMWVQTAQQFLIGAIHYYFDLGLSFVNTMFEILSSPIQDIIDEVVNGDNVVAQLHMSKLRDVQEKVLCNIGMELNNLASLVSNPALIEAMTPREGCELLDWSELNSATEPFDVILTIPEVKLESWRPILLLMINQLIKSLERRPQRTYKHSDELPQVLVMLDEFPRIGKVTAITNGLATLRSRGVTFALCVQSLANLNETYGDVSSRVIADQCSYKAVLGVTDATSQKYFSDLVGSVSSVQRSISANHDPFNGRVSGYSRNLSETREPIIYPHEFSMLKDIVLITPQGFLRVEKTLFYERRNWFMQQQLLKIRDQDIRDLVLSKHPVRGGRI